MLVPHDRGSTCSLNLSAYQIWAVVFVLVGLSFCSAFMYGRHQAAVHEMARLRQVKQDLERQFAERTTVAQETSLTAQERIELESRIRAEYESSVAAITAELTELYEVEAQARSLAGFGPRQSKAKVPVTFAIDEGKGGGGSSTAYDPDAMGGAAVSPPAVIYGMAVPSADLIIQEINVRKESLKALVAELMLRQDQVLRMPSICPAGSRQWSISSTFGYRKDPFTLRVTHHNGLDIRARKGSPVLATAKGVVKFAGWESDYGNLVKISHGNGIETWYAHLQAFSVKVGEHVEREDVIGKVGSTGRSTGPHIHYEVRVNGKNVNPYKYIRD